MSSISALLRRRSGNDHRTKRSSGKPIKAETNVTIRERQYRVPRRVDLIGDATVVTELWMLDVMDRMIATPGAFLDIGVNRGQTLLKLRAAFPHIPYIGVEPMAESIAYVNSMIRANGLADCTLVCAAVSHVDSGISTLRMRRKAKLDSMAFTSGNKRKLEKVALNPEKYEQRLVCTTSLDALGRTLEISPIAMIKIDVEGAEREVLEGMRNLLSTERPPVLLEILPISEPDEASEADQRLILELLGSHDYRMLRVVKGRKGERAIGLERVTTWPLFYAGNSKPFRDYVAVPMERMASLQDWIREPA